MTIQAGKLRLRFGYPAAAALCLCAVALGESFPAALLCSIIHESGHITALLFLGQQSVELRLRVTSVDIIDVGKATRTDIAQALVFLAGPLANGVTCALFYAAYRACGQPFFLRCVMIGAALGGFNLLPVYGTDGGELAQIVLRRALTERAAHVTLLVLTVAFMLPLLAAAFFVLLRSCSNYTLLIFAAAVAAEAFAGQ